MKASLLLLSVLTVLAACKNKPADTPSVPIASYYRPAASVPAFSGERAFSLLERQVAFGPRVPGTQAHTACAEFLRASLAATADSVSMQSFTFPGYDGVSLELHNIIARFNPGKQDRILLCAHWDSRPRADREAAPDAQAKAIPGANDGASGVAVLLHLAELMHEHRPDFGIDVVLFDGEDYGKESDESMFCIGSKYFSASIAPDYKPVFGILLDLVGDAEAVFPMEGSSRRYAGDVVELVWTVASRLYLKRFEAKPYSEIYDDHIPLNLTAGIKTVNIIDADLVGHATPIERRKYWHTLKDTPEQCSPITLGEVGTVLANIVYGLQPVAAPVASR